MFYVGCLCRVHLELFSGRAQMTARLKIRVFLPKKGSTRMFLFCIDNAYSKQMEVGDARSFGHESADRDSVP